MMIVILVMIKIKYHVSKLNTKKSLGTIINLYSNTSLITNSYI